MVIHNLNKVTKKFYDCMGEVIIGVGKDDVISIIGDTDTLTSLEKQINMFENSIGER